MRGELPNGTVGRGSARGRKHALLAAILLVALCWPLALLVIHSNSGHPDRGKRDGPVAENVAGGMQYHRVGDPSPGENHDAAMEEFKRQAEAHKELQANEAEQERIKAKAKAGLFGVVDEKKSLGDFGKEVVYDMDLDKTRPGHMWVPISILYDRNDGASADQDPLIKMCELDIARYAAEPWAMPMGGQMNKVSGCEDIQSQGVQIIHLSTLDRLLEESSVSVMSPSGFIFHETRCGSTLMANMLANVPTNLVWSESTGPWSVLHRCNGCPRKLVLRSLRSIIMAMGRSPFHKHVYFKLQSSENIAEYTEVLPDVPWIFLYREPVEVMMSRLGAQRVGMEGLEGEVEKRLDKRMDKKLGLVRKNAPRRSVDPVKKHALILADLCQKALKAYKETGTGYIIEYTHLPSVVYEHILPEHFGVPVTEEELQLMMAATSKYSKVADMGIHDKKSAFHDDTEVKHDKASNEVKYMSNQYLAGLYEQLNSLDALSGQPEPEV